MKPFTLTEGPLKGYTVEMASTEQIAHFTHEVDAFLAAIGLDWALVTDESSVSDFGLTPEEEAEAGAILGIPVLHMDRVIDVAVRLRAKHEGPL